MSHSSATHHLPHPHAPPVGWGMTSLVLGTVGLLLFFLPILGAPISGLGALIGLIGIGMARIDAS